MQEKEKACLDEIIQKVNDLFEGELTDQDKLVYVNNVIKGKLLESETLRQQAANNTKEQFANSPDLKTELLNAIMGALDAHTVDEHAGAKFADRTTRHQRYPAEQRGALRNAPRASDRLIFFLRFPRHRYRRKRQDLIRRGGGGLMAGGEFFHGVFHVGYDFVKTHDAVARSPAFRRNVGRFPAKAGTTSAEGFQRQRVKAP